ncbi:MAG: T9SS type A sorting domain-containing protein [Bacteroidota bacterium]
MKDFFSLKPPRHRSFRSGFLLICFSFFSLSLSAQEICNNNIDDDGDGFVDCADPDCGLSTVQSTVSLVTDDAEEEANSVELFDTNADLDFRPNKYIGVRFQALEIPHGSVITNAYISFTASSNQAGASGIEIYAEAVANSPTFTNLNNNITGRTRTSQNVSWSQASWIGGNKYNTPDLKAVIQEVVDLVAEGSDLNNITFIALPAASGKISAASYEDLDPTDRPTLFVEYAICDQDGDRIPDILDADADNDGIPNYLEGACKVASDVLNLQALDGNTDPVVAFNNANFTLQDIPVSMSAIQVNGNATLDDYVIDDFHLNGSFGPRIGVDNSLGVNDNVVINFEFSAAIEDLAIQINDIDDEDIIQINGYLGGQVVNLSAGDITINGVCVSFLGGNRVASVCPNNLVTNSVSASIGVDFPVAVDQLEVILYQQSPGDDGGSITIAAITYDCNNARDFDNDGIPDYKDADSDGDGIPDVIEAGGVDLDQDGRLDYPIAGDPLSMIDADLDGFADAQDASEGGSLPALPNTDGSGRFNFLDIDADDDGIVDNIEGQTTVDFIPPLFVDINQNGIDDAYENDLGGQAFVPANKDLMDLPDYLDLDTDNDGESDLIEGYDLSNDGVANTLPSGIDADGDGLDDAFDQIISSTTIFNPGNGDQTPLDFPAAANNPSDRAWRIFGGSSFPVEWLSFAAVWEEGEAKLDWATASETNADLYVVERSFDGRRFEGIGEVKAFGNSNETQTYAFRDAAVKNFQIWEVFYRLRQIDFDGSESYSNTVQLGITQTAQVVMEAYPVPAADNINLRFAMPEAGEVELKIFNGLGQTIYADNLSFEAGLQELSLAVDKLSAGIYFLQVGNESYSGTTRFVKQ